MKQQRRDFLKLVGASGSSFVLSQLMPTYVFGQKKEPHFFVMIGFAGAMDATLGLNPMDHSKFGTTVDHVFLDYVRDDIIRSGNIQLGPAAAALLPYTSDICVINGINMRIDIQHELRYIFSGVTDYSRSSFSTGVARVLQKRPIVLNLKTLDTVNENIYTISVESLNLFLSNTDVYSSLGELNKRLNEWGVCDLKNEFDSKLCQISDAQVINDIKTQWVKIQDLVTEDNKNFASLAASFMSGHVSTATSSEFLFGDLTLDTHANHEKKHLAAQKSLWDQIANLFKLFKAIEFQGKSLFDSTTFMVATEFSRTPFLNDLKGKDHNTETNSILLAGKNIQGNKTVGDSFILKGGPQASRHIGAAIDYDNGKVIFTMEDLAASTGGARIYPENIARTIAKIFGDDPRLQNVSSKYKALPGVVKS